MLYFHMFYSSTVNLIIICILIHNKSWGYCSVRSLHNICVFFLSCQSMWLITVVFSMSDNRAHKNHKNYVYKMKMMLVSWTWLHLVLDHFFSIDAWILLAKRFFFHFHLFFCFFYIFIRCRSSRICLMDLSLRVCIFYDSTILSFFTAAIRKSQRRVGEQEQDRLLALQSARMSLCPYLEKKKSAWKEKKKE